MNSPTSSRSISEVFYEIIRLHNKSPITTPNTDVPESIWSYALLQGFDQLSRFTHSLLHHQTQGNLATICATALNPLLYGIQGLLHHLSTLPEYQPNDRLVTLTAFLNTYIGDSHGSNHEPSAVTCRATDNTTESSIPTVTPVATLSH